MSGEPKDMPLRKPRQRWLSFRLRSLFVLVTLCGVALYVHNELDWHRKKRVAQAWVEALLQPADESALVEKRENASQEELLKLLRIVSGELPPCPEPHETNDQLEILRVGILALPEPRQRAAGVKLVVELFPDDAPKVLRRVIQHGTCPNTRALCLRVLSLYRERTDAELVLPLLTDREAEVRAAAADCLGIIHCPAYGIPLPGLYLGWAGDDDRVIASDPPIRIKHLVDRSRIKHLDDGGPRVSLAPIMGDQLRNDVIELPDSVRQALDRTMLAGEAVDERTAAARALVAWPPDTYKLRVAEWGVWIDDRGELALTQSVLDEIPAFVHRTSNAVESFRDRTRQTIMTITKPIMHLTTDRPLAVDIDVQIWRGRPWFAYPRPDDFSLSVAPVYGGTRARRNREPPLRKFDRNGAPELRPLSEGFPWLRPDHRVYGGSYGGGTEIVGMGLRWQSLIVAPQQLPWMAPPVVGEDKRFAWWGRLRQVPSSWVSNQGEAERFLYYDGPTLAPSPVRVAFDGSVLSYCTQDMFRELDDETSPPPPKHRFGLFVRVENARLKAYRVPLNELAASFVPGDFKAIEGDEVRALFLRILADRGLTSEEARGLYDVWEAQFFETEGSRLLTFLSGDEYDAFCPMQIRPTPTEVVRVGIVLTEL